MPAAIAAERLRRLRLAAQRLSPATAVASSTEATASVCGIQAQDVRAAGLALRSRVPDSSAARSTVTRTCFAPGRSAAPRT